jgi:hypothetical protein
VPLSIDSPLPIPVLPLLELKHNEDIAFATTVRQLNAHPPGSEFVVDVQVITTSALSKSFN